MTHTPYTAIKRAINDGFREKAYSLFLKNRHRLTKREIRSLWLDSNSGTQIKALLMASEPGCVVSDLRDQIEKSVVREDREMFSWLMMHIYDRPKAWLSTRSERFWWESGRPGQINVRLMKILLRFSGEPSHRKMVFKEACRRGNLPIVKCLSKDIDNYDEGEITRFLFATRLAERNQARIIKILMKSPVAGPQIELIELLYVKGYSDMIKILITIDHDFVIDDAFHAQCVEEYGRSTAQLRDFE